MKEYARDGEHLSVTELAGEVRVVALQDEHALPAAIELGADAPRLGRQPLFFHAAGGHEVHHRPDRPPPVAQRVVFRPRGIVARQRTVDVHEDVLGQVLGQGAIAAQAVGQAVDAVHVGVIQLPFGSGVACEDALDQVAFVQVGSGPVVSRVIVDTCYDTIGGQRVATESRKKVLGVLPPE